jgi:hypothetical protein
MYNHCCCYHFEFFPKGFQVKYDKDNNTTHQYIPFTQIITIRNDYIFEDKVSVITIILTDSIKYSFTFKGQGEGGDIYNNIISKIQV